MLSALASISIVDGVVEIFLFEERIQEAVFGREFMSELLNILVASLQL